MIRLLFIVLLAIVFGYASDTTALSQSNDVVVELKSDKKEKCCSCDSALVQDRWFYNYSECDTQTTQLSILANISKEDIDGSQVSLVSNFANKNLSGFQLSGGYNHVGDTIKGAQFSGFVNYARIVDGAQFASYVNVADVVNGWQIGDLNIADTVKGGQIGFVNVADHIDGYGIGFFTYADNGLFHVDYSVEESGMNRLTFATGKTIYTSYSVGYTFDGKTNPYLFGFGFGYHKDFSSLYLETGFTANLVLDRHTKLSDLDDEDEKDLELNEWRNNTLMQLNVRLGTELFSNVGIFAGATYNGLETHGNDQLMGPWTDDLTGTHENFHYWPGFEVGIRIGR